MCTAVFPPYEHGICTSRNTRAFGTQLSPDNKKRFQNCFALIFGATRKFHCTFLVFSSDLTSFCLDGCFPKLFFNWFGGEFETVHPYMPCVQVVLCIEDPLELFSKRKTVPIRPKTEVQQHNPSVEVGQHLRIFHEQCLHDSGFLKGCIITFRLFTTEDPVPPADPDLCNLIWAPTIDSKGYADGKQARENLKKHISHRH